MDTIPAGIVVSALFWHYYLCMDLNGVWIMHEYLDLGLGPTLIYFKVDVSQSDPFRRESTSLVVY